VPEVRLPQQDVALGQLEPGAELGGALNGELPVGDELAVGPGEDVDGTVEQRGIDDGDVADDKVVGVQPVDVVVLPGRL
jgi:hypothetical protein